MPVRFRPRAPQIRPVASTSYRPFSFPLWEVALTSARTCAEVCRNPGVRGGTFGGAFSECGGTLGFVPPRHQPPVSASPAHANRRTNTPHWQAGYTATAPAVAHTQQRGRIQTQAPTRACLLTPPKRSELEKHRGSNYPCANLPGRTHDTPPLAATLRGVTPFLPGTPGTN